MTKYLKRNYRTCNSQWNGKHDDQRINKTFKLRSQDQEYKYQRQQESKAGIAAAFFKIS